jgi:protein-tyrosine phosphatase
MAEAILKNKKIDGLEVKSAGIFAVNGSEASTHAKQVLDKNNIFHDHQSSLLTKEDLNWADLVLTMTISHKYAIRQQYPSVSAKLFTLKEFVGETFDHDVVDPFGGNLAIYQETYQELEKLINKVLEKIR